MAADIQHVVVLMLENRSFDCILGRLYPTDPYFDGLTLNESNVCGMTYGVWTAPDITSAIACTPDPDPGEAYTDIKMQLYGNGDPLPAVATMSGFAANYNSLPASEGYRDPGAVMHYFTPEQVPVISSLAKAFGVCDQWFASAPCQTWPNRFFVHTGTCQGYVDNSDFPIPFDAPSLFRRLEDQGVSWRVYFHDMPQSILLKDVWACALGHYRLFGQFLADAHTGALPAYSFIEPRYFTDLFDSQPPNDEHPPHNVLCGEQLIAQVYNAVRQSPCWKQTLLIITYDEHGGCYDHVPPPPAISPGGPFNNSYGFTFNAYGVRVPTVIVSPYVAPGSKIRPAPSAAGSTTPFDHTSIIRTVRDLFNIGGPLTARDNAAPSLLPALGLAAPNNDGPPSVTAATSAQTSSELSAWGAAPPNNMQASLAAASALLPTSGTPSASDISPASLPNASRYPTVAAAHAAATASTNSFLGL